MEPGGGKERIEPTMSHDARIRSGNDGNALALYNIWSSALLYLNEMHTLFGGETNSCACAWFHTARYRT